MTTYVSEKGLSTLERPRYSAGLLLEDDDLTSAVDYARNMMRLMFRSLFGCGVICGLDVTAKLTCNRTRVEVTIGKGVALSCTGEPIEIPKPVKITYDAKCEPPPASLWVTVCYREMCCRPRDISCSADDEGQKVQTRIMEGFEVRLYPKRPKCACSCQPPAPGDGDRRRDCCDDGEEETPPPQAAGAAAAAGAPGLQPPLIEGPGVVQAPYPARQPPFPDLCDCYRDHYDGKCECECCCPCVFIGLIDTAQTTDGAVDPNSSEPQTLRVSDEWVRRIRPVLTGYYKCIKQTVDTAGGTGTAATRGHGG